MWKSDTEIEDLLRRYRPVAQFSTFPNFQIPKSARLWPWAVAAAALLAVTIGFHAAVLPAPVPSSLIDPARVQAIAEELGGGPEGRVMAEWIARREAMLEQERIVRASAPGPERQ